MKVADRLLIAIVAGTALLVVCALVVVAVRPAPSYQADDTPEGVVHNYLFALQQRDYLRAYRYLSPTLKGYPASADIFSDDVYRNRWSFSVDDTTTWAVDGIRPLGARIEVVVRETHFVRGWLFGSHEYTNDFHVEVAREDGAWKIVGGERYFLYCWNNASSCR